MQSFELKIVTSQGVHYQAQAECLTIRSAMGDVSVLAKHIDYVCAIGNGKAVVNTGSEKKEAVCFGGVLSVNNGAVTVLASTFEWKEDIDTEQAEISLENARKVVKDSSIPKEVELSKLQIIRDMIRLEVAKN